MKKLLLILLTCLPALAQTSIAPLTLRLTDFPQSSPTDTVQIFSRNYASIDGLAGLVWRMENSGFAGLFPTSDSFARLSIGHIQPLTALDIRGTPQANSGLLYMNDQHTFTGSSGTGPLIFGAVGQQLAWSIGIKDNITPDNAYNVDVEGLPGVINSTPTRNLRFGVVATNSTWYPVSIHHTGYLSVNGGGGGANGVIQATDANLIMQGDTNAAGLGGLVSLEPSPTKYVNLGGGVKHNYRASAGNTTVATNDYFLLGTSSIDVEMMDASDVLSGRVVWIGAEAGDVVTIEAQAGDTIEGGASYVVTGGSESAWVGLESDGTSDWKAFAKPPTVSAAGYDTIEEDGTPLAQESVINFIGTTLTAAAGTGETTVTSDADVDALASNSTDGFWARTGAGTGAARTFSDTASVTWTHPAGTAGNPAANVNGVSIDNVFSTKVVTEGMATGLFSVTLPAQGDFGYVIVEFSVTAVEGGTTETIWYSYTVGGVNTDGSTVDAVESAVFVGAVRPSGGTLIAAGATDLTTDTFTFTVNAAALGLGSPVITVRYKVRNFSSAVITPL